MAVADIIRLFQVVTLGMTIVTLVASLWWGETHRSKAQYVVPAILLLSHQLFYYAYVFISGTDDPSRNAIIGVWSAVLRFQTVGTILAYVLYAGARKE